MNSRLGRTGPEGPTIGLRNVGRRQCERHRICRARVCPNEPWNRNLKVVEGEPVCYYADQAKKATGTTRFGDAGGSNPRPAEWAREIASNTSSAYIKGLTGAELRRAINETQQ